MRLVLEQQHEHGSQWVAMESIAAKIGCTAERLVGRMGLHGVVRGRRCPFRRSTSTRFGDCAVMLSGNPPFSRLWASASLRERAWKCAGLTERRLSNSEQPLEYLYEFTRAKSCETLPLRGAGAACGVRLGSTTHPGEGSSLCAGITLLSYLRHA